MNRRIPLLILLTGTAVMTAVSTFAAPPRIGFVYPAGGQAGATFEVSVGGQNLDDPIGVVVSGEGISAEILEHDKIPSAQVIDDYRDKFRELQPEFALSHLESVQRKMRYPFTAPQTFTETS